MATYPAHLPRPSYRGYGIRPQDALVRTDVEQGPARQRRRFTQIPYMIPVNIEYTDAEFEDFEAFWKTTLLHGQAWFNIDLLDGRGIVSVEARFVAAWQATPIGFDYWNVSATLERRAA